MPGDADDFYAEPGRWEKRTDAPVPAALLALWPPLPEQMFVLYNPRTKWYCYRRIPKNEDHGLICFASPPLAERYRTLYLPPATYDQICQIGLDAAFQIAREWHTIVNCIIFLDEQFIPIVHYFR